MLSDTVAVEATEPDAVPGSDTGSVTPTVNNAQGCTILGTSGANGLVGTSGNDVICSFGGDDTISGGARISSRNRRSARRRGAAGAVR
ncbi:hypothetical protein [Streptomyces sp. TLI_105]|uniref:hypothetical protein n=1 Tax=Streptomyces sp. TLI_105 TaxID=1881019 RepID=UPI00089539F3|nr:hypothetical protein [Streptomyces sp. TLI_105]SEE18871.1 hypothetical protein SAMN05428939_7657 [Streptomyces sp. TLI_105]